MLNKRCGYEQMVLTASLLVPGSEHVQNGINHKFHLHIPEQDVLHHWIPQQQEMEVAHIAWVVKEKMKMETGLHLSHHLLNSIQFFGCKISFLVYEPFHCRLPICSPPPPPPTWILQTDSGQTKLVSKSLPKLRAKSFLPNRISFQGAYPSKV
jgi:hypothetical protein